MVVDVGMHRIEDEATARDLFGDDAKRLADLYRDLMAHNVLTAAVVVGAVGVGGLRRR